MRWRIASAWFKIVSKFGVLVSRTSLWQHKNGSVTAKEKHREDMGLSGKDGNVTEVNKRIDDTEEDYHCKKN